MNGQLSAIKYIQKDTKYIYIRFHDFQIVLKSMSKVCQHQKLMGLN